VSLNGFKKLIDDNINRFSKVISHLDKAMENAKKEGTGL